MLQPHPSLFSFVIRRIGTSRLSDAVLWLIPFLFWFFPTFSFFCTLVKTTVMPPPRPRPVKRVQSRNNHSESTRIHKRFHSQCFHVNVCFIFLFCGLFVWFFFFISDEQTQTFAHAIGWIGAQQHAGANTSAWIKISLKYVYASCSGQRIKRRANAFFSALMSHWK